MKKERQREILNIISAQEIETQDQLLECLRRQGFPTTQTTVSRDIKELRLVKELTDRGTHKYAENKQKPANDETWRLRTIFREGVISFDLAQNILVLRTMPGLASAAGAAIDSMEIPSIVGCLAGNDTVLLVMRTNELAEDFCAEIHRMLST